MSRPRKPLERRDWTAWPQRVLCSASEMVHVALATYPGHADTKCGKEQLRCDVIWLDGCTHPSFAFLAAYARCPTCFAESPHQGAVQC